MDFAVGIGSANSHLNIILPAAWMHLIIPLLGRERDNSPWVLLAHCMANQMEKKHE